MNYDFRTGPHGAIQLRNALSDMENAQLVRRLDESDLAYLFKHALVQDTAYKSLMRHDRKRLHRLVGLALEQADGQGTGDLAPRLALHFEEAGDTERALVYFERAASDAATRYANPEALDFYTHALDAAQELPGALRDALYRARAKVFERIGDFESARADLERALRIASEREDTESEWQSLMDLGFAWTARDYARAGKYFERALELARMSDDARRIAHTLNRVGNWHMNNEDPDRALAFHNEALNVFQELDDTAGIAETEDLLGITNLIGSDLFAARTHFTRALRLFQQLDNPQGIATSLTTNFLFGASMQGETVAIPPRSGNMEEGLAEILQVTRQTGWRAGEAYGLWVMAEGFGAIGNYGRAFELLDSALRITREIDHRQWEAATLMVLGAVETNILDFENARKQLEHSLALAHEIGSMHWIRTMTGLLASVYVAQNDLTGAETVLDAALPPGTIAKTLGQRLSWAARVELALARHEPATAIAWLDDMMRIAPNITPETVIPHLWTLRAKALVQQGKIEEAKGFLLAARREAHSTQQGPLEWRALNVLAQAYRAAGEDDKAQATSSEAMEIVNALARTVNDETMRANFVTRAEQMVRGV